MARSWSSLERTKRGALALIAVAGALAVGGCGDDDEPADSGLGRAQLVARANAICKPHYQRITVAAQKVLAGGNLPDKRQFGRLAMGTIIPEYNAQIEQLRTLKPADDVAAQYKAWIATSYATLAEIRKAPPLITNAANFKTVNGQADALGLSEQCHVGPGG